MVGISKYRTLDLRKFLSLNVELSYFMTHLCAHLVVFILLKVYTTCI